MQNPHKQSQSRACLDLYLLRFLDSTKVALNDLQFKIILIYLTLAYLTLGAGPLFVLSETIDLIGRSKQHVTGTAALTLRQPRTGPEFMHENSLSAFHQTVETFSQCTIDVTQLINIGQSHL